MLYVMASMYVVVCTIHYFMLKIANLVHRCKKRQKKKLDILYTQISTIYEVRNFTIFGVVVMVNGARANYKGRFC